MGNPGMLFFVSQNLDAQTCWCCVTISTWVQQTVHVSKYLQYVMQKCSYTQHTQTCHREVCTTDEELLLWCMQPSPLSPPYSELEVSWFMEFEYTCTDRPIWSKNTTAICNINLTLIWTIRIHPGSLGYHKQASFPLVFLGKIVFAYVAKSPISLPHLR